MNKFLVKSHKGEEIIDADHTETAKAPADLKLPEEMPENYKEEDEKDPFAKWGKMTWEV